MLKLSKTKIILGIIGLSILLVFIEEFSGEKAESPKPSLIPSYSKERHVLAYFFYWYDLPYEGHKEYLAHHPIDPAASYTRVDWFENEFVDMDEAGIDTALAVYWSRNDAFSNEGLANMVEARRRLVRDGKPAPKIALFFDTNLYGKLPKKDRNLIHDEGKEKFFGIIEDFYESVPEEHRGTVEGRPIIWLFGNYQELLVDQTTIDYVYEKFTARFGVRPYIVREWTWNYARVPKLFGSKTDYQLPIITDDVYGWGASVRGYIDVEGGVVAVGPGYDERGLLDRPAQMFRERKEGAWYEENLKKAVAGGKPLLVVETWNEFHEASDIAHSVELGRTYIELTKEYTSGWREKK